MLEPISKLKLKHYPAYSIQAYVTTSKQPLKQAALYSI